MKHSLIRSRNESVKLFSYKDPLKATGVLKVYELDLGIGLTDITPIYTVSDLNTGYYSTEIITPNKDCYILILFNDNPIILRVGAPDLQFLYWSKAGKVYPYKHFNEFGVSVSEGNLTELEYGFYYYTPVETTLGYVEVLNHPIILEYPYAVAGSGVGITVDWRRTIIRQQFGIKTTNLNFKLNKINNTFNIKTIQNKFDIKSIQNKFDIDIIKQTFKVYCKN